MGHLESRTIWGLRLDGDLERLWWKLFIHVNSDLFEISQEQLWLLDTSASQGRQSVAKMMTSFAFSCLSDHRGEIGDSEMPSFPVNVLTEHRVLSLPLHDTTDRPQGILPWGTLFGIAPLCLNQNARWKDPPLATPVTVPG